MPTEDRRHGKLLPNPVTPPTTTCFTITIPNAVQYKAALFGVLGLLGDWYTWDHPTDGTVCADCEEAAQLWRDALANATFSDECGGSMSCEDVADCIETNELTQAAIIQQVLNNPELQDALSNVIGGNFTPGQTNVPGQPLPSGRWSENLTETEDCNFNVFWAQMDQMVEYLVNLGQDTLESIALWNAAIEAGQNVPIGNLLGKLKNGTTAGKVVEFAQWAAGAMKVAYEAGNTDANRLSIKCALFCEGKENDCFMSLDGAFNVLNSRLGGALNPASINTLPELAETMVTLFSNPSLALDTWLAFLLTSARVAGLLGVQGIDETLNLILAVAVNDANNDWIEFCDDCNTPETDCANMADWYPPPGGWGTKNGGIISADLFSPGDGKYYLKAWYTHGENDEIDEVYELRFTFSRPVTNIILKTVSGQGIAQYEGPAMNTITFNEDNDLGLIQWPLAIGNQAGALDLQVSFINDVGENTAVSLTQWCWETIPIS